MSSTDYEITNITSEVSRTCGLYWKIKINNNDECIVHFFLVVTYIHMFINYKIGTYYILYLFFNVRKLTFDKLKFILQIYHISNHKVYFWIGFIKEFFWFIYHVGDYTDRHMYNNYLSNIYKNNIIKIFVKSKYF